MTDKSVVWAALDVGTNSAKLLVARVFPETDRSPEPLLHALEITRMGENLVHTGEISAAAMDRTLAAIGRLLHQTDGLSLAGVSALGMEAFRRASNGSAFAARVQDTVGIPLRVLTGAEEARLGLEGVLRDIGPAPDGAATLTLDVGGGSTELALSDPAWEVSLPLGAVVVTEQMLPSDPHRCEDVRAMRRVLAERLREAWGKAPVQGRLRLVGVGGTVTTYAAMAAGLEGYDSARIHRSTLRRDEVRTWTDRLASLPLKQRREVRGLHPDRAPVIVGGGGVVEAAMEAVGVETLLVSHANLLHAYVMHEAARFLGIAGL